MSQKEDTDCLLLQTWSPKRSEMSSDRKESVLPESKSAQFTVSWEEAHRVISRAVAAFTAPQNAAFSRFLSRILHYAPFFTPPTCPKLEAALSAVALSLTVLTNLLLTRCCRWTRTEWHCRDLWWKFSHKICEISSRASWIGLQPWHRSALSIWGKGIEETMLDSTVMQLRIN